VRNYTTRHSKGYINVGENHGNGVTASADDVSPKQESPALRVHSDAEPGLELEEAVHVQACDLQQQANQYLPASESCEGKGYTPDVTLHEQLVATVS
jgi:hypothetical protein